MRGERGPSMMALVLLLLATVLYDSLIGTEEWAELEAFRDLTYPPGVGSYRCLRHPPPRLRH
jgi:hypothetical protein